MSKRHRIYLVDTSVYIFHAWFGMPESISDRHGEPVNAVYGFAHFLADLLADCKPKYIAGFFDESLGSCFRHQLYPQYKANREPPTENLEYQFSLCKKLLRSCGIRTYASRRYEADDLIASVAWHVSQRGHPVTIVSADKDLAQCLYKEKDELWHFRKSSPVRKKQIKKHFGVNSEQVADFLALCGDSVDNIPGITGVGSKTACRLMAHFGDIDGLLLDIDNAPELGIRGQARILEQIKKQKQDLKIFRKLTRLKTSALGRVSAAQLQRKKVNAESVHKILEKELGLRPSLPEKLVRAAK